MKYILNLSRISLEINEETPSAITIHIPAYQAGPEQELTPALQQQIDSCQSVRDLYLLFFEQKGDNPEIIDAFAVRKLELEGVLPSKAMPVVQREAA